MDMTKLEALLAESTIKTLLESKLQEEKTKKCILTTLAILGALAVVAGISYLVYRLVSADDYEDFDDDLYFDDDDLVDFFDEEEEEAEEEAEEEEVPAEEEASAEEEAPAEEE